MTRICSSLDSSPFGLCRQNVDSRAGSPWRLLNTMPVEGTGEALMACWNRSKHRPLVDSRSVKAGHSKVVA